VRKLLAGQGETPIRRLGPGDCFGEIALLGDHVRTASTHSVTSANVLAIDRDACQAMLSTLPPLRDLFNRLLEERVGMRPESRHALDMSNDVITMNAESLQGQIAPSPPEQPAARKRGWLSEEWRRPGAASAAP
jgi:CRP-like cAMP-binding protein